MNRRVAWGWRAASGPPQSRTRRDVSTPGRTLSVLECGGPDAAHGGEDARRSMERRLFEIDLLTDLEPGEAGRITIRSRSTMTREGSW
jgi:hypothetical protein